MKNTAKILVVAMFAIILFSGLASAVTFESGAHTLDQTSGTHTFDITLKSTITETVIVNATTITKNDKTITFESQTVDLTADTSKVVTITYTVQNGFNFDYTNQEKTTLKTTGENPASQEVKFVESDYCGSKNEYEASIELKIDDIDVDLGFGDEDDYWYLRDTVKIDVLFEDPNVDIEDIDIEWELWSNGRKIDDGEESMSDVDENDDDTITLTIKLDENMDDYDEEATLYVRAIGKTNDKDDDKDNKKVCESDSKTVDISLDKNFVIADELKINEKDFDYTKIEVSCEQEITISGEVVNIGTKDQDDLYLELYNKALGVNKRIEFDNIDSFDSEDFSYTFKVPENMAVGTYKVSVEVFDEDNDLYENDEDDKATQTIQFAITESCKAVKPTIAVKPLDVSPKAGEEMIVTTTITNLGDKPVIYTTTAEGFQEWAILKDVTPEVVSLAKGESKEVKFKFEVKKDAEGDKFFNVETIESGKTVLSQPVSVKVEKAAVLVDAFNKKNLQIIGIVVLNLILLVAIILVARKILKKK